MAHLALEVSVLTNSFEHIAYLLSGIRVRTVDNRSGGVRFDIGPMLARYPLVVTSRHRTVTEPA